MPTSAASAASAAAVTSAFFPNHPKFNFSSRIPTNPIFSRWRAGVKIKGDISCQVAVTTDVSPSSPSLPSDEESEAEAKVGQRIRVKVPLKVYHVSKAPGLDLNGMEGVIKQYVGVWKGRIISANLPFKVEFLVAVDGQEKPVKFFAHLKEDEFEYLDDV